MNDQQRRALCERLGIDFEDIKVEIDQTFIEIDLDSDSSEAILLSLGALHRKVDRIMTDLAGLESAVAAIEAAGVAGVEELKALGEEIDQLQAGEISQEQIDSLAARTNAVATSLATGVQEAQAQEPPAPAEGGEPPAEGGEPAGEGAEPGGEPPAEGGEPGGEPAGEPQG
jgi:hypothetical protein